MSVVEAVNRDLARMPGDLRDSALAATALAMAEQLDGDNSATSKSMCAKALLDTMAVLRGLAPPERVKDDVDQLAEKRRARRAGIPEAADLSDP